MVGRAVNCKGLDMIIIDRYDIRELEVNGYKVPLGSPHEFSPGVPHNIRMNDCTYYVGVDDTGMLHTDISVWNITKVYANDEIPDLIGRYLNVEIVKSDV